MNQENAIKIEELPDIINLVNMYHGYGMIKSTDFYEESLKNFSPHLTQGGLNIQNVNFTVEPTGSVVTKISFHTHDTYTLFDVHSGSMKLDVKKFLMEEEKFADKMHHIRRVKSDK